MAARASAGGPAAEIFLSQFDDRFTFQTFDDSPRKASRLSRILHGTFREHAGTLTALNERGAGVFVMVNEGDGKGRRRENVQRVRALFVDLDGSPLGPVQAAVLAPHCIVESSPARWHAYWRVADCPLQSFQPMQRALAGRFKSDPKVCDLPRVMRLPGFQHRKGQPFTTRTVIVHTDRAPYLLADLVEALGLVPLPSAAPRRRTLPCSIREGERNGTLLSLAAGLVRKGYGEEAVNGRLQRINAERCEPPLREMEVDTIVARAVGYGSSGFTVLPHKLLDSPQWRALPPPAHDVILTAFRRLDPCNNGNITLTWADFKGRPGFGDRKTFYAHRRRVLASGILLREQGRNAQRGRTADLFAIAACWLPDFMPKTQPGAGPKMPNSYIDKQDVAA